MSAQERWELEQLLREYDSRMAEMHRRRADMKIAMELLACGFVAQAYADAWRIGFEAALAVQVERQERERRRNWWQFWKR